MSILETLIGYIYLKKLFSTIVFLSKDKEFVATEFSSNSFFNIGSLPSE